MQEFLEIGQIVNTFGIKGMVKIKPFTDDINRFDDLEKIYIEKNNTKKEYEIEEVKYHKGMVLMKLKGVNTPEKAELLRNFGEEDYLKICKLTSIIRIANVLDRSHKQKIKNLKASYKGQKLNIYADCTDTEFSLEKNMFRNKISLFEEVFGVEPVLKFKRVD